MKRALACLTVAALAFALAASLSCRKGKNLSELEPVVVAVGTTFDADTVPRKFEPLQKYLEEKLDKPFKFQGFATTDEFKDFVNEGKAAFVYANPLEYFEVSDSCIVLVKASYPGTGSMTQGMIIVAEGEAVKMRDVSEMKDASVMIVADKSLGGYLSQKMFFSRSDLNLDLDFDLRKAPHGTADEVVAAVASREVEYGCVPVGTVSTDKSERGVEVLTPNCDRVPVEVFAFVEIGGDKMLGGKVRDVLKDIPKDDPVLKPLGLENFSLATQAEYDVVTNFLKQDKIDKAQRLSEAPASTASKP
jgi:phosphonate transport system substrate-binding protein